MRKEQLLTIILTVLCLGNLNAKDFSETVLLKLDCSGFIVSASTDMSAAADPYNWLSASGMQWTSENCYAQNVTTPANVAFIGQAVRFGTTSTGVGKAETPALDLTAKAGEQIKLVVKLTAGANKTGSLVVKMDGAELGTISASTGNGGSQFGASYYSFEYPLTNGTSASRIELIHSKTEDGGNLYVQELKIVKEPVTLIKMDCSSFKTNSSKEMSSPDASVGYNWLACIGQNITSSFCYAQNQATFGQSVRLGGSGGNGKFTLPAMDLTTTGSAKVKLYFEVAAANKTNDMNLSVKLDNATVLASINTLTDGDSGETGTIFGDKWYEYDLEVTGGTAASSISFEGSINDDDSKIAQIYVRNLRIYIESGGQGTSIAETSASGNIINVYPNPFNDYIAVSEPLNTLAIYAISGQKVLETSNVATMVTTTGLPSGYYLVRMTDKNNNTYSAKILKK